MNGYSLTYRHLDRCGDSQVPAKYVVDNLDVCKIRVNTHTHSHRAYFIKNTLEIKALAKPFFRFLQAIPLNLNIRNGAPPLQWRQYPCVLIRHYRMA